MNENKQDGRGFIGYEYKGITVKHDMADLYTDCYPSFGWTLEQSPLFMSYHNGQPSNENHLRPCSLLDNPEALVDMVETTGAYSTDLQDPEDVQDLAAKCTDAAAGWSDVADEIWKCAGHCSGCKSQQSA